MYTADSVQPPLVGRVVINYLCGHPIRAMIFAILFFLCLLPGREFLKPDFTHTGFFYDDDPMLLEFEKFERQFGNDDAMIVAIHSPSGIFDQDSVNLIHDVTVELWKVPEVIRVDSLSNYNWVHAEEDDIMVDPFLPDDEEPTEAFLEERKNIALNHEVLPDYLISRDAKTAMAFARIKPGFEVAPDAEAIVESVRAIAKKYQIGDHKLYVTGGPAITYGFQEAAVGDLETIVPLVVFMIVFFLAATLRRVSGILLSFTVVIFSTVAALSLMGWLGFEMTNGTAILPQILLAIGIADAVHILVTYYRAYADGLKRKDAVRYSLNKNFVPTLLTSISTSIGFFSLASADIKSLAGLGTTAGFGVLLAWFFTYFILGPLMLLIPVKAAVVPRDKQKSRYESHGRIVDVLHRHRSPIIAVFILLTGAAGLVASKNEISSDPFLYFREGFPLRVASDFIDENVGGVRQLEIVIRSGEEEGVKYPDFLAVVEDFQKWIEASIPEVTRTISIVDILKSTHRSLHGDDEAFYKLADSPEAIAQELFLYTMSLPQGMDINDRITVKNDAMRLSVLWTLSNSARIMAEIARIEAKAIELGLDITTTGKGKLYQAMNGYVVELFIKSISIALLLISLLLAVVFRSLKLGLIALASNCIPLIMGGAVLYFLGHSLDVGTVLVSSVCLGIAVDDTIHILSNYNRLRQTGMAPQQAMTEVFNHTGPALVLTTLILVAGFGTFALATFIPNLYFGVMCAIILTVALFTDFTFLPALLTAAVPEPKSDSEPDSEPDSEFEGQESKLQPTSFGS